MIETEDEVTEEAPDVDGLGPATLPEFNDAVGIETLAEKPKRGRKARAESPEAVQQAQNLESTREMMLQTVMQLDRMVSVLLDVKNEEEEYIEGVANAIAPLANHYASKSESVVAMAIFAGLGLLSYAVVKYQRFRERIRRQANGNEGAE